MAGLSSGWIPDRPCAGRGSIRNREANRKVVAGAGPCYVRGRGWSAPTRGRTRTLKSQTQAGKKDVAYLESLRRMVPSDLVDLLSALRGDVDMEAAAMTSAALAERVLKEAARVSEYPGGDPEGLERHIACRLANALRVDYSGSDDGDEILGRCYNRVADAVVDDMRPFIQVCVCMGWADGRLTADEIEIMDAALCQLRILRKRRHELLDLCRRPIKPVDLAKSLGQVAGDEQKTWSLLALAWSVALADRVTAKPEVEAYHELARYLGVSQATADRVRDRVTRRFSQRLDAAHADLDEKIANAAQAAVAAAGLGHYLQAATGLKTLSLLLGCAMEPGGRGLPRCASGSKSDWVLAPALIAGTLFLRSLKGNPEDHKLLLMALAVMEENA